MLKTIRSAAKKTKIIAFPETSHMALSPLLGQQVCEFRIGVTVILKTGPKDD